MVFRILLKRPQNPQRHSAVKRYGGPGKLIHLETSLPLRLLVRETGSWGFSATMDLIRNKNMPIAKRVIGDESRKVHSEQKNFSLLSKTKVLVDSTKVSSKTLHDNLGTRLLGDHRLS